MESKSSSAPGLFARARSRGVLRVAASYAVIAWLLLQIADVTFDPLGVPKWVMTAMIVAAALGFPIALALSWFYELGDAGITRDTESATAIRPSFHGPRRYADVAIIGILLVVVAVLLVRESGIGKPKPPASPTIAVLPFENLSGDPEQQYFSDGLAEEMLDRLGRVPGLTVVARSSSFSFRDKGLDAKAIAERLGVTTVLEGSIRRDRQRLRLTARLVDGATGKQAWSGSFDRELTDIFAVQAELATAIIEAVIPSALGDAALSAKPLTSDVGAYDMYLLARSRLAVRHPNAMPEAIKYARQAVELDPGFARAHALLGSTLLFGLIYGDMPEEERPAVLREAEASIFRALSLDPELSEAHGAYANLLRQTNRAGAEEEYKRALALNPNNAATWHDYGVYLANVANRPVEAAAAGRRSLELDPRSTATWMNHLARLQLTGDAAAIAAAYDRAIELLVDIEGGLDHIALGAFLSGRPVEAMKCLLATEKAGLRGFQPLWIVRARAWSFVDLDMMDRALAGVTTDDKIFKPVRLWMKIDNAGLRGDYGKLEPLYAELASTLGESNPALHSSKAFWLAVQGRYDEAARSLALAEPLLQEDLPYRLGGSLLQGQMLPAKLRILRATGREAEARKFLDQTLTELNKRRPDESGPNGMDHFSWVALGIAEAEAGHQDKAVAALRNAMRYAALPVDFRPELPWFKRLEGFGAYAEVLRERERRAQKIKAELIRLDSAK